MTLQSIFLQTWAEQIGTTVTGFFGNFVEGLGIFAILLFIGAVAFALLVGVILIRRRFDFEGSGEPLGHINIDIMGKYMLSGNLARWEEVDDEQLELLKGEAPLVAVPDVLRQMYKEKNLFIYTMKSPDDTDILDKFGKKTYIISSGDIWSEKYSWESQKGKLHYVLYLSEKGKRTVLHFIQPKK